MKEIILAAEKDGEVVLDGLYDLHAVYLLPPQVINQSTKRICLNQGQYGLFFYGGTSMSAFEST